MKFPPIFSLAIFFILDTIALVFYLLVFTAPAAVFLKNITLALYIARTYAVYGSKKTVIKLFKFKGSSRKDIFKKAIKLGGGSLIPYVNVWAVWSDYKDDLREEKINISQNISIKEKVEQEKDIAKDSVDDLNIDEEKKENIKSRKDIKYDAIERDERAENIENIRRERRGLEDEKEMEESEDVRYEEGQDTESVENVWMTRKSIKKDIKGKEANNKKTDKEKDKGEMSEVEKLSEQIDNPEVYSPDTLYTDIDRYKEDIDERNIEEKENASASSATNKKENINSDKLNVFKKKKELDNKSDEIFEKRFGKEAKERMQRDRSIKKGENPEDIKKESDKDNYREDANTLEEKVEILHTDTGGIRTKDYEDNKKDFRKEEAYKEIINKDKEKEIRNIELKKVENKAIKIAEESLVKNLIKKRIEESEKRFGIDTNELDRLKEEEKNL